MLINPELLQAVANDADNDEPRLVYADWLEEHGEHAFAKFIRLQCEIAKLPTDAPRRQELEKRLFPEPRRVILADGTSQIEETWRDRMQNLLRGQHEVTNDYGTPEPQHGHLTVEYERGFPHLLRCHSLLFEQMAEHLFHYAPTIRSLHLGNPGVRQVLTMPQLNRIQSLCLRGPTRVKAVGSGVTTETSGDYDTVQLLQAIANCDCLANLVDLSLIDFGWDMKSADDLLQLQFLAESPRLPNLRNVNIRYVGDTLFDPVFFESEVRLDGSSCAVLLKCHVYISINNPIW